MDEYHETPEETQQLRRLLQAAVDHYPRLLVAQCSLQWPRPRDSIALKDIIT